MLATWVAVLQLFYTCLLKTQMSLSNLLVSCFLYLCLTIINQHIFRLIAPVKVWPAPYETTRQLQVSSTDDSWNQWIIPFLRHMDWIYYLRQQSIVLFYATFGISGLLNLLLLYYFWIASLTLTNVSTVIQHKAPVNRRMPYSNTRFAMQATFNLVVHICFQLSNEYREIHRSQEEASEIAIFCLAWLLLGIFVILQMGLCDVNMSAASHRTIGHSLRTNSF